MKSSVILTDSMLKLVTAKWLGKPSKVKTPGLWFSSFRGADYLTDVDNPDALLQLQGSDGIDTIQLMSNVVAIESIKRLHIHTVIRGLIAGSALVVCWAMLT